MTWTTDDYIVSSWTAAKGKTLRDFCSLMLSTGICTPTELDNILINSSVGAALNDNKLIMSVDAMSLLFLLSLEDPTMMERMQAHAEDIEAWNNCIFHGDIAGWAGWITALAADHFDVRISDIISCANMNKMINDYWKPYHCVAEVWMYEEIYKPELIKKGLIPNE